jgi:AcrR family transcriptional regulator
MGRRSEHTHEELRSMAILTGNQMMAEGGFAAFSARKLARRIGYTVGTIYNVFGTHECLIASINGHTLDELAQCVQQRLAAGAEGLAQLQALATTYLDFACTHHQRWSALFEAPRGSKADVPDWYLAKREALLQLLEAPLRPLVSNPGAAKLAASTLWASIHGICILGTSGRLASSSSYALQEMMDDLILNYLRGLAYAKS